MIAFAPAKINIGLYVTKKRMDGYHNIETIFYPLPLYDVLEILNSEKFEITEYGISAGCKTEQNICYKAWKLLNENYSIPPVKVHLLKNIPIEAGLGGGSSDGVAMLKTLNKFFSIGLNNTQLKQYALSLGSDCPFFVESKPVYGTSRGEQMQDIQLDFSGKFLLLFKPPMGISTAEAFSKICIEHHESLLTDIGYDISTWKHHIRNVFEKLFEQHFPEIIQIKQKLYESGAVYVQMSGSGSAYYAIFENDVDLRGLSPVGWFYRKLLL